MRRQLTTSDPSGFAPHDHVAWCGEGQEDLGRVAIAAFSQAASRGERMLFVSEQPAPEQLGALEDLASLLDSGALQLSTVEDAYRHGSDPAAQFAVFEELVEQALAEGHTGVCVVADNSQLAGDSGEDFAAWLAWEAMADHLQAVHPVNGVCYFDRRRVSSARLADLATMHPVLSDSFEAPGFQLFIDGDAVRVVGMLDVWHAEQLRRILTSAPKLTDSVLDLSEIEFIDHRALLALNEVADAGQKVRLRGAREIVRRVWELLDVSAHALEFC